MCGIFGVLALDGRSLPELEKWLRVGNKLLEHRGPDDFGIWTSSDCSVGLAHRRLSILDLSSSARQPMRDTQGNVLSYNGEIYNFRELRYELQNSGSFFRTNSDTEVLLSLYEKTGIDAITKLRGMFAFAIWDETQRKLVLARDRIGIKPLYYYKQSDTLYFASEQKALLPFLPTISTAKGALAEYLTFQYTISNQSMFEGICEVPPAHILSAEAGNVHLKRYWDVTYNIDFGKTENELKSELRDLVEDSVSVHLQSDVEVASYVSGGIDSSLLYSLASTKLGQGLKAFHGTFGTPAGYDESRFAREVVKSQAGELHIRDITSTDFIENIGRVIYHLDQPIAGPGSFPQYMVSQMASHQVKVVLGGQGGDEVFGGYARYLLAYFEQCIKAAIDGTYKNGNFVVTIESIVPNLGVLREYKPLLQEFWSSGLFGPLDQRFLRLINRSTDFKDEVDWSQLDIGIVYERFYEIFNSRTNVAKEAYFDSMTHFEFKTLLPALLQVEDRMSMAHGIESRVPFLDHHIVEFAATVPADIKFRDGKLKHFLKSTFEHDVPKQVMNRRDKMGFPVPLSEWLNRDLKEFVSDTVASMETKSRPGFNPAAIRKNLEQTRKFSRKTWAMICLELWHQQFHDRSSHFRALLK